MIGKRSSIGSGLVVYMVLLMGAVMGANQGYTATSTEGANINYTGEAVIMGGEVTPLNTTVDVDDPADDKVGRMIQTGVIDFTETMMHACFTVAFTVADWTATGAYYISPIVPQSVVNGVFNLLGLFPVAIGGYAVLSRVNRLV